MNVFCCTNPAEITSGLLGLLLRPGENDYSDDLVFLPSRRSIREVEKRIAAASGGAAILPKLVPLGEGATDTDEQPAPKIERVMELAGKIRARFGYSFDSAITIAAQLIQTQDHLDTEEAAAPDWKNLVDENLAAHFSDKAELLQMINTEELTDAKKRVADIRGWIDEIGKFKRVFAAGSTASIPATRDLLAAIAQMPNGHIILPGKIAKMPGNLIESHPYWSEEKLLKKIGICAADVRMIDTGKSNADFLNQAFQPDLETAPIHNTPHYIECEGEAAEANLAAQIIRDCIASGKSVIAISPDVASSYRLAHNLAASGIAADLSIGQPATMLPIAKLLLSIIEIWTNPNDRIINTIGILKHSFAREFAGLDKFIRDNFRERPGKFEDFIKFDPGLIKVLSSPKTDFGESLATAAEYISAADIWNDQSKIVWQAAAAADDFNPKTAGEFKAIFSYILSGEKIRAADNSDASVSVLGTIEARMLTADAVVICGLNEGMFPKKGFELPLLSTAAANAAGIPASARKTGLMAMDFINLSCGREVWWLRSKTIGQTAAIKSRFLSRVEVLGLSATPHKTELPEFQPMKWTPPTPPATNDPVYATALDTLFHNPFEFYVKHILKLRIMDEIRTTPNAKDYGLCVHSVIENSDENSAKADLENMFQNAAEKFIDKKLMSGYFWSKRFNESVPIITEILTEAAGKKSEIKGGAVINGRQVFARADMIYDGIALDIKTGGAPTKTSFNLGNAPQLPLTAYILECGGFAEFGKAKFREMVFLDLKKNKIDRYSDPAIIIKTIEKAGKMFEYYSHDGAEYINMNSDRKYHTTDHLARKSN